MSESASVLRKACLTRSVLAPEHSDWVLAETVRKHLPDLLADVEALRGRVEQLEDALTPTHKWHKEQTAQLREIMGEGHA